MVSAELNYRNHIPYGYFAIETSNLNFYGGDKDLIWSLNRLISLVEFDKYDEHNIKIDSLYFIKSTKNKSYFIYKIYIINVLLI